VGQEIWYLRYFFEFSPTEGNILSPANFMQIYLLLVKFLWVEFFFSSLRQEQRSFRNSSDVPGSSGNNLGMWEALPIDSLFWLDPRLDLIFQVITRFFGKSPSSNNYQPGELPD